MSHDTTQVPIHAERSYARRMPLSRIADARANLSTPVLRVFSVVEPRHRLALVGDTVVSSLVSVIEKSLCLCIFGSLVGSDSSWCAGSSGGASGGVERVEVWKGVGREGGEDGAVAWRRDHERLRGSARVGRPAACRSVMLLLDSTANGKLLIHHRRDRLHGTHRVCLPVAQRSKSLSVAMTPNGSCWVRLMRIVTIGGGGGSSRPSWDRAGLSRSGYQCQVGQCVCRQCLEGHVGCS